MNHGSSHDIYVSKLQLTRENGLYNVSALVDGEPLWFQSADHPLRVAPEGFANALLVQAMFLGRDLVFEDPLCPTWLENSRQLMDIFHKWWGQLPITIHSPQQEKPVHYKGDKTGLCFSGGVDSFYSLITYAEPIDFIIMVHGYDIALSDEAGAAHASRNTREVARACGVTPLVVQTNLRQHHVAGKRYKYSYEGALVAMGYLIEDMHTLILSSDYSREMSAQVDTLIGAHWQTTPRRSSADINIIVYGDQYSRYEKLRQIAANPLLGKHLRVCQENLRPDFDLGGQYLNCGACEKCLRTLLTIMQTTSLDGYECFANTRHLVQSINKLAYAEGDYKYSSAYYEEICATAADPSLKHAIHALLWRTRFLDRHPWLGRKGRKLMAKLFIAWHNLKEYFRR